MNTYISLLRGINLGSHNKIKMDALRHMFTGLGCQTVQTYIQSGNVVFRAADTSPAELSADIQAQLAAEFRMQVPVMTLTLQTLEQIAAANVFAAQPDKDEAFFHLTLLSETPAAAQLDKIDASKYLPEEFSIVDRAIYLYCPNGYGNTKLSNGFFESKLKTIATTRNWKTTHELLRMARTMSQISG